MANLTESRLYKISAWKDNAVKIVLTQGEGSSASNPNYNKTLNFQLYESGENGSTLLTIPASGLDIFLAFERPDGTADLIEGTRVNESDISFPVKNTLTTTAGIVKGEIRLISSDSVVKFYGINFNVYGGTNNSNIENTEEFEALTRALQKVVNLTGDGTIADLDTVIAHSGTNPAASGVIYDYLVANYYTKTESDNKYQTLANKTQTIDSSRQTTTQNATQYPSVAAVKDFLYANFLTEDEIDNLLDNIYSKTESDDKFALKSDTYTKSETYTKTESDDIFALKNNTYTKSEINAIQSENNKRFALAMTVAFDDNGIPVQFSGNTSFSAGAFSNTAITTVFIGNNVQLIQGGAFATCTNLTDIYVDKSQSTITIQEQAFPDNATIHYIDGFNVGELIIAAIKYLNTIKANAADVYTKTEADNKFQTLSNKTHQIDSSRLTTTADNEHYPSVSGLKDFTYGNFYDKDETDDLISSIVPVEFTVTLMSNQWTLDGKQYIDLPSGIVIGENTRVMDVECLNESAVANAWGGESISIVIDTEGNANEEIYALAVADDDSTPNVNVNIKIVLSEVNVVESVPQ